MHEIEQEAKVFTNYLVGRETSEDVVKIYESVINNNDGLDKAERKLMHFLVRHPKSVGYIDAGLILYNPYSEVRRRLYIMLAILEASTEYSDLFLAKKRSLLYIFVGAYCGMRAIFKSLIGFIVVKAIVSS